MSTEHPTEQLTITAQVKPFHFKWPIGDYKLHEMDKKIIKSDLFTIRGLESTQKWQLHLHPKGNRQSSEGHTSLFLHCPSDTHNFQFPTMFSLKIKSTNGKKDYTRNTTRILTFSRQSQSWGFPKFIENKVLEERASDLLPNGSLTLICTGNVILDIKTPEVCGRGLFEDAKCMRESHAGRGVTLVASDGTELPVHKFILCARSPVFAAMFDHDTEEKKTGRVVVKDVRPDVLRGLVSFMYTDEAPEDVKELAIELLIASNKYQIPRLLYLIDEHIRNNLTVEKVLNILNHAILLDLPTMKDVCLQFIQSNAKEVKESQSWKECADVDVLKVLSEFLLK